MAVTEVKVGDALAPIIYDDKAYKEYIARTFWFRKGLMGTSPDKPIQVRKDLTSKDGGTIRFYFKSANKSDPIRGDNTLKGNEQQMSYYSQDVTVDQKRWGYKLGGRQTEQYAAVQLKKDAKEAAIEDMKDWTDRNLFQTLGTHTDSNRAYYCQGSASSSITNSTTSKLKLDDVLKAKYQAKTGNSGATRRMRPITFNKMEMERYVCILHPAAAMHLKRSADWKRLGEYTASRGPSNPLQTGAFMDYDNILFYEADNVWKKNTGSGKAGVAHNLLLGAQAGFYGWAQTFKSVEEYDDYDNQWGVAVGEISGTEKAVFNSVDNGGMVIYSYADIS